MIPMNQTVTVENYIGLGDYGKPNFAAPVTTVCRWESRNRLVRDKTGKEVVASIECWLPANVACALDSRLTYQGRAYTVLTVEEVPDLGGALLYRKVRA